MIGRLGVRLMVSLGVVAAMLVVASPSFAGCNPGRSNDFPTGYQNNWARGDGTHIFDEIDGNLDVQTPFIYQVSGNRDVNDTYAWIMLASFDGSQLAQIGPAKANDNVRYIKVQCSNANDGSLVNFYYDGLNVGDTPHLEILNTGTGVKNFYKNTFSYPNFCGNVHYGYDPYLAVTADEVHTKASQLPGDTGDHELFNNMGITRHDGTGLTMYSSGGWNLHASFGGTKLDSDNETEQWDKGC
jgi:hypothetical protein